MEKTKDQKATQIITEKPHQECMLVLNEWKNCDAVFQEINLDDASTGYFSTFDAVSKYFEVSDETLKVIHRESLEHFKQDGVTVAKGEKLKKVGKKFLSTSYAPSLTLLTPRAVLRMGAKITKNKIGDQIISILLNNAQENKREKNKKHMSDKKKLTFTIDANIKEAFQSYANKKNMSMTECFAELIKEKNPEFFEEYEELKEWDHYDYFKNEKIVEQVEKIENNENIKYKDLNRILSGKE
jgi:hypothetical protein